MLFQDRVDIGKLALGDDINKSFFHSMKLEEERQPGQPNEDSFKQPMCSYLSLPNNETTSHTENITENKNISVITRAEGLDAEYEKEVNYFTENFKHLALFAASHPSKYMLKCVKELNTKLGHIEDE